MATPIFFSNDFANASENKLKNITTDFKLLP